MRICDFVFVMRPVIFIPAWGFYLLGAAEGAGLSPFGGRIPPGRAALCLTAILASAYLLNQVFDRESDEKNGKCLFLARGVVSVRTVVLMSLAALLVASFAYHRVEGSSKAVLVAALVLSFAYSLPPVRLCSRPFFDLAANALGYGGIAFVLGFGASSSVSLRAILSTIPYVLLVGATFLHTTILDVEGDRAAGKKSTTVRIGNAASRTGAAALHACAFAVALLARNPTAAILTGVSLPVTFYPLRRPDVWTSSFVVQANTLVVALGATVFWPAFLAVLVPLIALSRFYHRRRFGITYPGPARSVSASG